LPRKFGYDKCRAHLSTLICSGDVTTEDALGEMEKDPYVDNNLDEDKATVINKLGITEQEFDQLMNLPVKSHRDYPSNSFIFDDLSGLRNSFKKTLQRLLNNKLYLNLERVNFFRRLGDL